MAMETENAHRAFAVLSILLSKPSSQLTLQQHTQIRLTSLVEAWETALAHR